MPKKNNLRVFTLTYNIKDKDCSLILEDKFLNASVEEKINFLGEFAESINIIKNKIIEEQDKLSIETQEDEVKNIAG